MPDPDKLHIGKYAFVLDIANVIVLLLLFSIAGYYYGQLPEEIPIRFDAKGTPIAHRSKATLFASPFLFMDTHLAHRPLRLQCLPADEEAEVSPAGPGALKINAPVTTIALKYY